MPFRAQGRRGVYTDRHRRALVFVRLISLPPFGVDETTDDRRSLVSFCQQWSRDLGLPSSGDCEDLTYLRWLESLDESELILFNDSLANVLQFDYDYDCYVAELEGDSTAQDAPGPSHPLRG
jgi:hypothetical protein